ncbi:MAG: hypothetical protein JO097_00350, partial [Acidobacteriaceae bacterium]|nr:hypothetical protein [Acidobacteriaceae bacterium]
SQENREQIFGTVPFIAKWLLVEYPAAWRNHAIEKSNFSEMVKRHLSSYADAVPNSRQILIRQAHKSRDGFVLCFVVNSREDEPEVGQLEVESYDQLLNLNFATLEHSAENQKLDHPLFLVCTHGTHDKCCAKFGLPVYKAARQQAGDEAWQCSHIGGDRFAANLICFPHGIYYGHVTPADVEPILAAYRRGEIYLKNYRGRCCFPRAAQIAEYFIRSESGIKRIASLHFLTSKQTDAGTWRASFTSRPDGNLHQVEFRVREAQFNAYLTCSSTTEKPMLRYELSSYSVAQAQT